ncbi:cortex morphogenetic protein CmpA [Alkalibacillus haloalkaliphilus]|nr:cortex morphogenetic protein CmpA [Alkalibacillus haloalkaliphilus]
MPSWLQNQLLKAYASKDIQQIKTLNQCWFFYYRKLLND